MSEAAPALRPWPLSRAALRARLDGDPRRWVLALAAASGLAGSLFGWEQSDGGKSAGPYLLIPLVLSLLAPALGVLALYLQGGLLRWTGRWLGGTARAVELRAALAWAQVPVLLVAWPAIPRVAARIALAATEDAPGWLIAPADLFGAVAGPLSILVELAGLLGLALTVRNVGEAQRFGTWRALLNLALAQLAPLALALIGLVAWYLLDRARLR